MKLSLDELDYLLQKRSTQFHNALNDIGPWANVWKSAQLVKEVAEEILKKEPKKKCGK